MFDMCINDLCLTMSWDQAMTQPCCCAWGVQGPESQDYITQDFLWLNDGFIQTGKAWDILESLIDFPRPVFSW